ncbi:putative GCR1-dependent translation factor 1 [Mollisia scopiformis]|uniref:Putative GCR1-dependent translation factor 1 n=1 Tax=Mollisia scopiformis TaxID=149040 RepID=A0A194X2G7_MOLSC|nr:putative GCR1-dependent translation factor 1 [Mollisia scopiformis]KUJ14386.1 putative GCR1-dependent translation factor 1 [Mollisia scopiformis]
MKFRRRPAPLLLLLLPSLATALSAAAQDNIQSTLSKNTQPRDARIDPHPSPVVDLAAKSKLDIGTKDAPVDGKDGKPHAGPWVGSEKDSKDTKKDSKKSKSEDGELVTTKTDTSKMVTPDGEKIPAVNDGVMDDPHRQLPKEGTTGTEGGVSEKDKARKAQEGQTGEKLEKKPDSPKEAPPLPHSEQTKIKSEKGEKTTKDADSYDDDSGEGLGGLEKPNDLPNKPNNLPHPLPDSANKDHLDIAKPGSKDSAKYDLPEDDAGEGLIQPLHSFVLSLTMILFSEIGDKTFLIAALMAMKHDRLLVFSAAFSALITMTVLSAVLGHAVPTLIPKRFTNYLAAALFLIFGGRMLKEGLAMSPDEGVGAEMKEVEMELEEKEHQARQQGRRRSSISPYALEMGLGSRGTRKSRSGSRLPSPPRSPSESPDRSPAPSGSSFKSFLAGLSNLLGLLLSPAWVQTFVMTFLGEWGDRSQIATIAMAAGQDYWWVTGGAILGHCACTGVAVIGGRAIAGKVSLRVVTLGGAIAFLVFGVIYLIEALYSA